jgi:hypothetical protein
MTIDDFVKVLDAVTRFIGAVAPPALVLYVLIRFGPSLREFFSSLGEFTLKGALGRCLEPGQVGAIRDRPRPLSLTWQPRPRGPMSTGCRRRGRPPRY